MFMDNAYIFQIFLRMGFPTLVPTDQGESSEVVLMQILADSLYPTGWNLAAKIYPRINFR